MRTIWSALLVLCVAVPLRAQTPAPAPVTPEEIAADSAAIRGSAVAHRNFPFSWAGRGFLGGVVAGPFGTAFVYHRAGDSGVEVPSAVLDSVRSAGGSDAGHSDAFASGYAEGVRQRRREASIAGGMIGTGVLIFTIFQVFDIVGNGVGGGTPGGGGGTPALRVPISIPIGH